MPAMNAAPPSRSLGRAGVRFPAPWLPLALAAGLLAAPSPGAAEGPSAGEKLFALKLRPLFAEKCHACHADEPERLRGGFDMRSREAVLRGGEVFGEEVLVPGQGAESFLYLLSAWKEPDFEMPPKESERLTGEEAGWIRDWIDAGAPWPADERVAWIQDRFGEGERVPTSGGLSEDWTNRRYDPADLWAYRPVVRSEIPAGAGIGEHPVDAFIDAALAEAGLPAAPEADPLALIRRAAFGLTGLPPDPGEVDAFLRARERDPEAAWTELIERLLGDPAYGEQWARHWLDAARYADSSGFANDWERPNAWRYRDYVVRAFNEDKPYDRFVREQLAGDEIGRREDAEMLVAAGFLRMGPWEHTSMSVDRETRQLFLDDITDAVGQVFLAHALQCARCHDHKFDPVPTRDYYAMQAIFATTQFAEVETGWLPGENLSGMEEDRRLHLRRYEENERVLAELEALRRDYDRAWFEERGLPWKTREEARRAGASSDEIPAGANLRTPDEFGRERIARKWRQRFRWEADRYEPYALTVYNGKTRAWRSINSRIDMPEDPLGEGELEQTAILTGGDPFAPGEPVAPGVLSAVPGGREHPVPNTAEGRRTALADWIADPGNTLTARVMVNRIWQHHFGRGIAGNPNNFGATGEKPSHPELLDWLAAEFVERGWSVKEMHRLVMSSAAYRRSTSHPEPARVGEQDPGGLLLAAFLPRRLAAEELRDAMLAVSGELNREMGGIPARPGMNLEAALQPRLIMGTFAPAYVPHPEPRQRHRRTLYAHKTRGHRDPMLEVFNQPGSEIPCEARDASNITPQAFALFNSEESLSRALAFAERVLREEEGGPDEAVVERAFLLAVGRAPEPDESAAALAHWREMEGVQEQVRWRPREFPLEIVREASEENTGEIFTFTERLFGYEDYLPDRQPHEVDARVRALADLCLVLFNSNEFAYLH